jgi:hypothetical protein
VLPAPMEPPGNFELVTVYGDVAYVAGHAPISGSEVLVQGTVGRDLKRPFAAGRRGASYLIRMARAKADGLLRISVGRPPGGIKLS